MWVEGPVCGWMWLEYGDLGDCGRSQAWSWHLDSMVRNCGSSLSRGKLLAHLTVFIQHFLEPRARLAGAWGYLQSTGSFNLEQC